MVPPNERNVEPSWHSAATLASAIVALGLVMSWPLGPAEAPPRTDRQPASEPCTAATTSRTSSAATVGSPAWRIITADGRAASALCVQAGRCRSRVSLRAPAGGAAARVIAACEPSRAAERSCGEFDPPVPYCRHERKSDIPLHPRRIRKAWRALPVGHPRTRQASAKVGPVAPFGARSPPERRGGA